MIKKETRKMNIEFQNQEETILTVKTTSGETYGFYGNQAFFPGLPRIALKTPSSTPYNLKNNNVDYFINT